MRDISDAIYHAYVIHPGVCNNAYDLVKEAALTMEIVQSVVSKISIQSWYDRIDIIKLDIKYIHGSWDKLFYSSVVGLWNVEITDSLYRYIIETNHRFYKPYYYISEDIILELRWLCDKCNSLIETFIMDGLSTGYHLFFKAFDAYSYNKERILNLKCI